MNTSDNDDRLGLERFDDVAAPDQWDDIMNRAGAAGSTSGERPSGGRWNTSWYLAAAAFLLVLVGGLIVVARQRSGDADGPATDPGVSLPTPGSDPDATTVPTTTVLPGVTPTSEPSSEGSTPDSEPTTTVASTTVPPTEPVASDVGWTTTCTDRLGDGDRPADDTGLDIFGPLGAVPGLDITMPQYRSPEQESAATVTAGVGRVDGGVVVLARPSEGQQTDAFVVSVVDDDGSIRWRRCMDGAQASSLLAATGGNEVLMSIYTSTSPGIDRWQAIDLQTGADVDAPPIPTDLAMVTQEGRFVLFTFSDERVPTPDDDMVVLDLVTGDLQSIPYPETADAQAFQQQYELVDTGNGGFTILQSLASERSVVRNVYADGAWRSDDASILAAAGITAFATFDDRGWEGRNGLGDVVWSRPDLLDIRQEGFLSDESGSVTVINGCLEQGEGGCVRGSLFGIETATGETLWERSGLRGVAAVGDGFAIIVNDDGDGWEMIDTLTGELVDDSQQWAGIEPFEQQCCGGGDFVWVGRQGGVVFAVNEGHVRVWYPKERSRRDDRGGAHRLRPSVIGGQRLDDGDQLVDRVDGDVGLCCPASLFDRLDHALSTVVHVAVHDGREPGFTSPRQLVAAAVTDVRGLGRRYPESTDDPLERRRVGLHRADPARPAEHVASARQGRLVPVAHLTLVAVAEHADGGPAAHPIQEFDDLAVGFADRAIDTDAERGVDALPSVAW